MLRMLLVVVLGLALAVVAQADEPKPRTEPKLPWQRLLTGDNARKAADLGKRISELELADNYAGAIRLREELLALRIKEQGAEHWQTVNEKFALTVRTKVAALPENKRAAWRQAVQSTWAALRLGQQAQYGKALPLWQEFLSVCREILGEEHPFTANGYSNVATNLRFQGKYGEAGPLCQKALDIRRQALGEDHPDTATGYHDLALNQHCQGQYPEAGRLYQKALNTRRQVLGEDHPETAKCYHHLAITLDAQSRYAEARPMHQKALNIRRQVLGENHPETAHSYNYFALNLHKQGQYAEAGLLYQKALDIYRQALGEDHPNTARCYNNIASNLEAQGKYSEAGLLYQKALDIRRQVLGEDHPDTAASYHHIASNLQVQGQHAEAGPLFQKALDICRKTLGEGHSNTAASYISVAANLEAQGQYVEAGPLFQKALEIYRQALGEDHPDTATSYNNIAANLSARGRYAEAGPLFQKALNIRRQALGEDHHDTAASYNNVAFNLKKQGQYAEAGPLYQKALDIFRKAHSEDHPGMASCYYNIAAILNAQGKFTEAGPLYKKALDLRRQALGENHPITVTSYTGAGANLLAQGNYPEALAALEKAARSYEAARLSVAAGLQRAAFGAERSPYPLLVVTRIRSDRANEAWAALEANLARGLLDEMTLRHHPSPAPEEQQQRDQLRTQRAALDPRILKLATRTQRTDAETAELERLVGQRRQLEQLLADLAVRLSQREVAGLAPLQAGLPADAAFVTWVDVADSSGGVHEHWGCVVRPQGPPRWERLPGSGTGGRWTKEDTALPIQLSAALAQAAPAAEVAALAQKLHAQRLAPLTKHLDGVRHLLVAPVHWMAGVPIEALTDQYTVSYTPSCTSLARLKDRERPRGTGLLAVGDPVFPPARAVTPLPALPPGGLLITQVLPGGAAALARLQAGDVLVAYAGQDLDSAEQLGRLFAAKGNEKVVVKVWREGQEQLSERELAPGRLGVALAKEPARQAIAARRQADQLLAQFSRGQRYAELPGTQVEIARLTELFDARDVTTLTRAAATEQRLDELRRAGALQQVRYLHFATHGQANNVRAFESSLVLTPPGRLPEVRVGEPYLNGLLTASEVLDYWKLDAELVTLSACESGLGRHGGGDGLLGFAQAFLMAGSRSVCLSLWQVDDTATALFMDRFYRNLLGKRADGAKPMPKASALREAKDWLRTVPASEALERLGTLTQGVVRGERPAREEMQAVPKPKDAAKDYRPYAHPRYWAAFILIGDPE